MRVYGVAKTIADLFKARNRVGLGETIRPTRDADLLGFGDLSAESLRTVFGALCALPVEPDGLGINAKSR